MAYDIDNQIDLVKQPSLTKTVSKGRVSLKKGRAVREDSEELALDK
jgi:hypothetical protein